MIMWKSVLQSASRRASCGMPMARTKTLVSTGNNGAASSFPIPMLSKWGRPTISSCRYKVTVTVTKGGNSTGGGNEDKDDTSESSNATSTSTNATTTPKLTVSKKGKTTTGAATSSARIAVPRKNVDKSMQFPDQEKEQALMRLHHEIQVHYKHGNYTEAARVSKELLADTTEHFGKDHPATASAYNNVGLMHKYMGDWVESRKAYHEALRVYGRVVGKDHASYAAALHNIGALNRTQVHMDNELTAMQRIQLNDDAMEYLSEAWTIRQAELGDFHPHTVSSRSSFGSALASQVIKQKNNSSSTTKLSKLTKQRWEAAEEHLREALATAIANPRGEAVKEEEELNQENNHDHNTQNHSERKIKTLSAAAAAQNLAVFLKALGTEIIPNNETTQTNNDNDNDSTVRVIHESAVAEAHDLYRQALFVRVQLLHEAHPDILATKFSLAELLAAMGKKEEANALREEMVKTYNVQEMEEGRVNTKKE